MAPGYTSLSQRPDEDDDDLAMARDRRDGAMPPTSSPPASAAATGAFASSPMTMTSGFLSLAESAFTPLSMGGGDDAFSSVFQRPASAGGADDDADAQVHDGGLGLSYRGGRLTAGQETAAPTGGQQGWPARTAAAAARPWQGSGSTVATAPAGSAAHAQLLWPPKNNTSSTPATRAAKPSPTSAQETGYDLLPAASPALSSDSTSNSGTSPADHDSPLLGPSAAMSPGSYMAGFSDSTGTDADKPASPSQQPVNGGREKLDKTPDGQHRQQPQQAPTPASPSGSAAATTAADARSSIASSYTAEINRVGTHGSDQTITSTAAAGMVKPQFTNRRMSQAQPPQPPPPPSTSDDAAEPRPQIVRTASTRKGEPLPLKHPLPDLNTRSGAYTGNIAQLEATAERLSMTSSIDDAIRDAHQELKRSDSQRSSVLAARTLSRENSTQGFSRNSSIVGINTAARQGGYSPGGYIMAPTNSVTTRLRSGSKSSVTGSVTGLGPTGLSSSILPPEPSPLAPDADAAAGFLSRHGPGKSSVRSVRSARPSLAEIAEVDLPLTLTAAALDQADRLAGDHDDDDDDDEETIRASAHQHVEPEFADDLAPDAQASWQRQPMLDRGFLHRTYLDDPALGLHFGKAGSYAQYAPVPSPPPPPPPQQQQQPVVRGEATRQRSGSAGSAATFEQGENAFGDFDGVHWDPDTVAAQFPAGEQQQQQRDDQQAGYVEEEAEPRPLRRRLSTGPRPPMAPRPKSYFDEASGREMLFYPAPVPAMLNLPAKLSRKPRGGGGAAPARNVRRSQIFGAAMPHASRESRVWITDPLEGAGLSPPLGQGGPAHGEGLRAPNDNRMSRISSHFMEGTEFAPMETDEQEPAVVKEDRIFHRRSQDLRRPQRLTAEKAADRRQSRMSLMPEGLPPQLLFDVPADAPPRLEAKGGSAMATLDSILDASAAAPVSAFTDHVFAGHLGAEVYGVEKKKTKDNKAKRQARGAAMSVAANLAPPEPPAAEAREVKKRGSFLSLMGHTRRNPEPVDDGRKSTVRIVDDERQRLSGSIDGEEVSPRGAEDQMRPDDEDEEDEEGEEEEEDGEDDEDDEGDGEAYHGPPTTLLAELQLRKQQQKMRTRPLNRAYPNGLHSTLLELDTVAEMERRSRNRKRVNLAWEDPAARLDRGDDDGDDEDVPLGMLLAAKQTGNNDISAVAAELNRPLGLMERRDMEDNEPLSRRRDRLQGREDSAPAAVRPAYLPGANPTRMSSLNPLSSGGVAAPLAGSQILEPPAEDEGEGEGETLGERMRRLKAADPLPRARPVSSAFSAELLSQFGDDSNKKGAKGKGKGPAGNNESAPPPAEEEETLGQRRRRLQAEREAREREIGSGGSAGGSSGPHVNAAALNALTGGNPNGLADPRASRRMSRTLSMADILAGHPKNAATTGGGLDPREQERRRREEEALRTARNHDAQMAAFRAQMPVVLKDPREGMSQAAAGGFTAGRFNGGSAGMLGHPQQLRPTASMVNLGQSGAAYGGMGMGTSMGVGMGMGMGQHAQSPMGMPQYNGSGFLPQHQQQVGMNAMGMNMNGMGMGMGMNLGMGAAPVAGYNPSAMFPGMPMQMYTPTSPQQLDSIERWRQGVMP